MHIIAKSLFLYYRHKLIRTRVFVDKLSLILPKRIRAYLCAPFGLGRIFLSLLLILSLALQPVMGAQINDSIFMSPQADPYSLALRSSLGDPNIGITITDEEAQDQLVEDGVTEDLAALNTDPDQAQVITRDERNAVDFYVSDQAVKAAVSVLNKLVEQGKLKAEEAERLEGIMEELEDVDPESLALCEGGSTGFLFNLESFFITTAYAANGDGCILRFYDGSIKELSPEGKQALRAAIVAQSEVTIKELLPEYQKLRQELGLIGNEDVHYTDGSYDQITRYQTLRNQLMSHMRNFELCSDNPGALRNAEFLNSAPDLSQQLSPFISIAESYRLGADAFADRSIGTNYSGADAIAQFREQAKFINQDQVNNAIEVVFLTEGLDQLPEEALTSAQREQYVERLGAAFRQSLNLIDSQLQMGSPDFVSKSDVQEWLDHTALLPVTNAMDLIWNELELDSSLSQNDLSDLRQGYNWETSRTLAESGVVAIIHAALGLKINRVAETNKGLGNFFSGGTKPKASELKTWAEAQGWKPTQTSNGPLTYVDSNGVKRLTIKQGSGRTPGSDKPHVEVRDPTGQRIDPRTGDPVTKRSPENHVEIDFDL